MNARLASALFALSGALVLLAGALYITFAPDRKAETVLASTTSAEVSTCPASDIAKRIEGLNVGKVAAFEILDTPIDLSDVSFNDADGKPKTVADMKGRTLLLNLWATWCAPCREEMPELLALNEVFREAPFDVVAVSIDAGGDDRPKQFYAEENLSALPFYHDGSMATFTTLKRAKLAPGLPTTILVGPDGCARGVLKAPAHWASEDAKALVAAAIGAEG